MRTLLIAIYAYYSRPQVLKIRKIKQEQEQEQERDGEVISRNNPKLLKRNSGGIGIQYTMPYSQKYTPSHCFFRKFAGWEGK